VCHNVVHLSHKGPQGREVNVMTFEELKDMVKRVLNDPCVSRDYVLGYLQGLADVMGSDVVSKDYIYLKITELVRG